MTQQERLTNRIAAINFLNTVINEIAPKLIAHYKKNTPKFGQTGNHGALTEKSSLYFSEIRSQMTRKLGGEHYLDMYLIGAYKESLELQLFTKFQGEWTSPEVMQFRAGIWLPEPGAYFTPLPMITMQQVTEVSNEIEYIEANISQMQKRVTELKQSVYPAISR